MIQYFYSDQSEIRLWQVVIKKRVHKDRDKVVTDYFWSPIILNHEDKPLHTNIELSGHYNEISIYNSHRYENLILVDGWIYPAIILRIRNWIKILHS